jgi:hypothetical protein
MELDFESFLAPVDPGLLTACLTHSWSWLEPLRPMHPMAIYFLDTSFGDLERVADSTPVLLARLQVPEIAGRRSGSSWRPNLCRRFPSPP